MNNRHPAAEPGMLETVLQLASAAVEAIDGGKCTLDDALDHVPDECRRTLEHLLTLVYRYRKVIRRSWQKFCRKAPAPEVAALLDAALTQCRFQQAVAPQSVVNVAVTLARPFHADKFVNAVLRAALREEFVEPSSAQDILPEAVLKRWRRDFPADTVENFAGLFLTKPFFTFRLCRGVEVPAKCELIREYGTFRFATGKPGGGDRFQRIQARCVLHSGSGNRIVCFAGGKSVAGLPEIAGYMRCSRRKNIDGG